MVVTVLDESDPAFSEVDGLWNASLDRIEVAVWHCDSDYLLFGLNCDC